MRLAQMWCGRGVEKIWDRHGAEMNSEGVHVRSTFLSRSWGRNLGWCYWHSNCDLYSMTMCIWMCHIYGLICIYENVQGVAFHVKNASSSLAKWLKAWACTVQSNEDYDRFDRNLYKPIEIIQCHKDFAHIFNCLYEIAKEENASKPFDFRRFRAFQMKQDHWIK